MKLKLFIPRVLLLTAIMIFSFTSYSKSSTHIYSVTDSLVPANTGNKQKLILKIPVDPISTEVINSYKEEEFTAELSDIEADYSKTGNTKKTLLQLLRAMKVRKAFRDSRNKMRLFSDLAKVSARLKLYPLAMQCYYHSTQISDENNQASNYNHSYTQDAPTQNYSSIKNKETGREFFADRNEIKATEEQKIFFSIDTAKIKNDNDKSPDSEPVGVSNILESFEDNKPAFGYALIIHVKQPLSGRRKAFTGFDNVGHMFITLIKYNDDNSIVSRSFGFYPDKNSTFSATPLHPNAPSVFKDDALHNWDEAIGKFISKKRFDKIIRLLNKYEHKIYNLNQNNCTDFGLNIASIVGISISDVNGKWPLGKGNNPANAGQSILEKKFTHADTENKDDLFICNSKSLEK
jgi:hypothetical protein